MLKVEEISKKFGDFQAINNLSFEVKVGDVMGFLGPNGAGKTTSMRVITGYLKSDGGRVLINNKDIDENPIYTKSQIGYLPEGVPLYLDFSPALYLDYVCSVRKVKDAKTQIQKVIQDLQLEDVKDVLSIPLLGVIPESKTVLQASNSGIPVTAYQDSESGQAYLDAIDRFLGNDRPLRFTEVEKPSFLKRIFGGR